MRQRGAAAQPQQYDTTTTTTVEEFSSVSDATPRRRSRARVLPQQPPRHPLHQQQEAEEKDVYSTDEDEAFVGSRLSRRTRSSQELDTVSLTNNSTPKNVPQHRPLTYQQQQPYLYSDAPRSGGLLLESSSTPWNKSSHHRPPSSLNLQDFHVLYRTAHHVPDKQYRHYLRGKHRRPPPLFGITHKCAAHTCLGFSVVAIFFLVGVGILLDTQPLLIKGVLPQHILMPGTDDDTNRNNNGELDESRQTKPIALYKLPGDGERLTAAMSAYQAAVAYLLCALYCCHVLYRFPSRFFPFWCGSSPNMNRRGDYQSVGSNPDDSSNGGLPIYDGNDHDHDHDDDDDKSPPGMSSTYVHARSVWNALVVRTRQWLADKGWYQPGKKSSSSRSKTHRRKNKKTG